MTKVVIDKLEIEVTAKDQASEPIKGITGSLGGLSKVAGGALAATAGLAAAGLGAVISGSIEANSELEKSTLQFETLLGGADAAASHIQDLYKFAAATPFETGPIIQASKSLLTFGGTALDTMENLTMFGNAAAITGQPINDVAFWMGRAYSAIQGGRPFGEAAARLQEMGILTGDTRAKLEAMSKDGASASDVWGTLTGDFGKFDGAMEKQAGTMEGLGSTISDVFGQVMGKAFQPFFLSAKEVMSTVAGIVQGPEFAAIATSVAAAITPLADNFSMIAQLVLTDLGPALINGIIIPFAQLASTVGPPLLQLMGTLLTSFAGLAQVLFNDVAKIIAELITALLPVIPPLLAALIPVLTTVADAFTQIVLALIPLLPPLLQLITTILVPLAKLFSDVIAAIMPLITAVLGILIQLFLQVINAIMPLLSQILPPLTNLVMVLIQALMPLIMALLPVIAPILKLLIDLLMPIVSALMPILVLLVNGLASALQLAIPYIQQFATWIQDHVVPAIDGIGRAIRPVIDWIQNLAGKLSSIKLPSWLTPGSPTPFEIGLRGIGNAANQLATKQLPAMAVGMRFGNMPGQMPLSPAMVGAGGGMGPQIILQYQPTFSMADQAELKNKLQPMLNQAIRDYNRGTPK